MPEHEYWERLPLSAGALWVAPDYVDTFSETFSCYDDVAEYPGDTIKDEPRTQIRRAESMLPEREGELSDGILKVYSHPPLLQFQTIDPLAKVQREFRALAMCRSYGMPTVEPILCAVQRTVFGTVRSCSILTRSVGQLTPLRDWLKSKPVYSPEDFERVAWLMQEIGKTLRSVHDHHFFLFTFRAKNILVREEEDGTFEWHVIDLPYARPLHSRLQARYGQRADIGGILGTVSRDVGGFALEHFYRGYLPDPLGRSDAALRAMAASSIQGQLKQTPIRGALKQNKRRAKTYLR